MKLKNVKVGMEVVVKKENHYRLSKNEVVEVVDIDLLNTEQNVWVKTDRTSNRYWLNHKDIKKLKPEKVNTNIVTLDGSKDTLVDFR